MAVRWLILIPLFLLACSKQTCEPPREASVRIVADDTLIAMETVTRQAEEMGAYVAEARVWREGERVRATLILRIPAKNLTSAMANVRRAAQRVESESISTRGMNAPWIPSPSS